METKKQGAAFNPRYLSREEILDQAIYDYMLDVITDDIARQRFKVALQDRARELKLLQVVNGLIKSQEAARRKKTRDKAIDQVGAKTGLQLDLGDGGVVIKTIDNYLKIIRADEKFQSIKFNELSYAPEKEVNGITERWEDADDSEAKRYIEKTYSLYNANKYDDAIRIRFKEKAYHPIKDIINSLEWDGTEHIADLLTKWMKCEDSPYTREVSRLIFAGGINRLYSPGCKFDDMPVLVGIRQGEGKSTFVRWLALQDNFFREVNDIDGQKGMEAIEGAWICEVSELLALTKIKEVEAAKSYFSRLVDTYRRPFDKRVTEHKRQCIFIGTTNKQQFLIDKTGNRRYYPVIVEQNGYELFEHQEEIRADILQCWAEAKAKYDKGQMPPYANRKLIQVIQEKQEQAVEDDYRVGLIEEYLSDKDTVCILELWQRALGNDFSKPAKRDSNDISAILQSIGGWERLQKTRRHLSYGPQKVWIKMENKYQKNG